MNELELQQQRRAERLSAALDAAEAGRDPDIDPREDPELAALLSTATALRKAWSEAEPATGYAARSRSLVLATMELRREQLAGERERSTPSKVVPFYRRWNVLAPVASAAAAAAVTLLITTFGASGGPSGGATDSATSATPPSPQPSLASAQPAPEFDEAARPPFVASLDATPELGNLTSRSVVEELQRIEASLAAIETRAASGLPVEGPLLRGLTETTTSLASRIESDPDSVTGQTVVTFIQAAATSRTVLDTVQVSGNDSDALEAAQNAAQDGVVVASLFISRVGGVE